ncbi:hypothetical protein NQ837_004423 [Providencia rettgeri]|uniref:DUF6896 domain-containing protein n=1 Tax=Providencia TaxID=586 RepID=UPI00065DF479|nr:MULTISPECIES: hypothetical protein [Providencia]APC10564.1 hypothetical protein RB151_008590 [Providencia rettgeri]AVL74183.1 hypothetical protein CEQ08_10760 [Providencia rettgeri]EJD6500172.1 hypothetical protein [Providencia rettgeri]EJD6540966.1 hypothetical protein [Providencia rettgeri]EJD6643595.1 hypothetical protein [Providencia rettgeri]
MLIPINDSALRNFVVIQKKLVTSFMQQYPNAKDYQFLLDFPKHGTIQVDDNTWNFSKHGKGIKFYQDDSSSATVVDIHCNIAEPEMFDLWRLIQYFQLDNDAELKSLLDEMVRSEDLLLVSDKFYTFKS